MDFDNVDVTFRGVPICSENYLSVEETAEALRAQGLTVITQAYDLVLPELFITIEPRTNIWYWDKNYWSREEFFEETVEP